MGIKKISELEELKNLQKQLDVIKKLYMSF